MLDIALVYLTIGFIVSLSTLLYAVVAALILRPDMPLGTFKGFMRVIGIYALMALIWPAVIVNLVKG